MADHPLPMAPHRLHKQAMPPAADAPADRDLLDRFVAHGDQAAFAAWSSATGRWCTAQQLSRSRGIRQISSIFRAGWGIGETRPPLMSCPWSGYNNAS